MPTSKLILGDCLEVMKTIGNVDAVVTDPPYGNETPYTSYVDTRENLAKLVNEFMPLSLSIAKRVIVTPGVRNIYLYPEYTWILSWVNMAGIGSSSWGFSCWQPIIVYGKDPYLENKKGRRPDTLYQRMNQVPKVDHPCPKPSNVMRWIIDRTTNPGDTILDPFMGSGQTGVAAWQMGRNFIGIEKDPAYFKIAEQQIKDAQQQPVLNMEM